MGLLSAFLGIKEIKCDSGKERQYTMKPNASGKCPWCGKSLAGLIKKFNHIPLIYNLQDIFPDSLIGTGLAKKGCILLFKMLQKSSLRILGKQKD